MKIIIATLLSVASLPTSAQQPAGGAAQHAGAQPTQIVMGILTDKTSEKPLAGVTVTALGLGRSTLTDSLGRYVLRGIPVGRWQFAYSCAGYLEVVIPEVLVTSGKEVVLDAQLEEKIVSLQGVVVKASRKGAALNEYTAGSVTSFNLEEVTRYAGGRNDPSKLVSNYAGVVENSDARNDIVVRGNSPTGVLWRIEGLPSPSPNHFAALGTTGGPVSALNTNALKTSDFLTGAFPAEYGNALAAVFDINLRSGNTSRAEETFQLNLFSGLEADVEGPLNRKDNGAAYLASYRYSFAQIATWAGLNIGTKAIPQYQDWVYNITTGPSRLGKFSFFGMGGLSHIALIGSEVDSTDLFAQSDQDGYEKSNFSIFGIRHQVDLGARSYLRTAVSYARTVDVYDQYQYPDPVPPYQNRWWQYHSGDTTNSWRFSTFYNEKVNSRLSYRVGLTAEDLGFKTLVLDKTGRPPTAPFDTVSSYSGVPFLGQAFAEFKFRWSEPFSITAGLHEMWFSLNHSHSLEPRASISYKLAHAQVLTLSYGLHSELQPLPIYVQTVDEQSGARDSANRRLGFTRAQHVILSYERRWSGDWRIRAEGYYQYLFDVPVEPTPSGFSMLNAGADFGFPDKVGLVNKGTGSNVGLELTLEKFLSRGYYVLVTTSLFDSRYKGSDGVERNTAFNSKYVANVLAGREWRLNNSGGALTLDLRLSSIGGRYTTPVDVKASTKAGYEILDTLNYDAQRLDGYFRLDTKFGIRLNNGKRHFSQTLYLDLQNVTNRKNIFIEEYNHAHEDLTPVYQIGFFPDVLYRIQF